MKVEFIPSSIIVSDLLEAPNPAKEEIPQFISFVYNYFIPEEERAKHESLIASSIKLVLMTPQLKITTNRAFRCLIC